LVDILKPQNVLINFILKEWLLIIASVGLVLSSLYTKHFPDYSIRELQVLFILLTLFVAVNGLEHSGLITRFSQAIEKGKAIPLKLIITTFILAMLITNDIALIVIVPLTLALDINRRDILVILEALAANAGSALTPFGNPQNLFIYWFYDLSPTIFITTIAPFSIAFLIILMISSLLIKTRGNKTKLLIMVKVNKSAYTYGFLLLVVLLSVLHVLPVLTALLVLIYALLFDRKTLRIDYALLTSFLLFFGLADNMQILLTSEIEHSGHVFLFSAFASQIISNVPTTLLFAKFTSNWEALLWGVNAGGFGSLFGSLANLIAYKLYISHSSTKNSALFTAKFLILEFIAFCLSIGLYFVLRGIQ